MAEVTAFRNNALPYPIYAQPWAVVFPMLDADGDLVTGATTPDAERSLNGDTFADCTNESTEIATASGVYYLLLTAAEMTADIVTVIAKSATAGMKTTTITLYPRKLVSLRAATAAGGAAGSITLDASANATDDYYNGCVVAAVIDTLNEVRVITDYTGSSKVAAVTPNWNVTPDSDDTFTVYLPEGRQVNQADITNLLAAAIATPTVAGVLEVDVTHWIGTAAATPTVAGVPEVDATHWVGGAIPAVTVTGVPEVDVTHWIGTAAATPTVAGVPEVDVTHWRGTAVPAEHTAGYPIVTVKDGTGTGEINTNAGAVALVDLVTTLTTYTGNTVQTGDSFARLGAPAAASVSADILAIDNFVDDIESRLGTPSNLGSGATVAANLVDIEGQTDDIGVAGAGLTAIADQVWDEDATGHQTLGTFGQAIGDPVADTNTIYKAVVTDATGATVGVDVVAVKAETVTILADTDNIQTRIPAALVAGRIDASVGAMAADVLTAAATAADFTTEIQAGLATPTNITAGTITTVTNLTNLPAITANWLTAAGTAADFGAEIATAVLTTAMTEAYAADGAAPTLAQALFQILAREYEFAISGDTLTAKKLDGSTTAMTFTLAPAGGPYTSITRAS